MAESELEEDLHYIMLMDARTNKLLHDMFVRKEAIPKQGEIVTFEMNQYTVVEHPKKLIAFHLSEDKRSIANISHLIYLFEEKDDDEKFPWMRT